MRTHCWRNMAFRDWRKAIPVSALPCKSAKTKTNGPRRWRQRCMFVVYVRVGASVGAQAICIIGHLAVKICFFLFLQENE